MAFVSKAVCILEIQAISLFRDILMEQSSYFRSMFGQFREKSDASIELKDIADPKLMGQVKRVSPKYKTMFQEVGKFKRDPVANFQILT